MSWESKDFPGTMIYSGVFGEQPHPGAFYIPKPGNTLISIARIAYGSPTNKPGDMLIHRASIINRSDYNIKLAMQGKLTYRYGSGNDCNSLSIPAKDLVYKVVKYKKSGQERPLASEAGWIALCGTKYNPIWIPPLNRAEPSPIPGGPPIIGPLSLPMTKKLTPLSPVAPVTPKKTMPSPGEQKPTSSVVKYVPVKGREFPMWAVFGLGTVLLGTAVYMSTRD